VSNTAQPRDSGGSMLVSSPPPCRHLPVTESYLRSRLI